MATVLPALRTGHGRIILADREEVESDAFWHSGEGRGAGGCAAAVGKGTAAYAYPAAAPRLRGTVSVTWASGRDQQLCAAIPWMRGVLESGQDLVLHCNQSVHRGPLLAAAVACEVYGTDPVRSLEGIAARRHQVWWGFHGVGDRVSGDRRSHDLFQAMDWLGGRHARRTAHPGATPAPQKIAALGGGGAQRGRGVM